MLSYSPDALWEIVPKIANEIKISRGIKKWDFLAVKPDLWMNIFGFFMSRTASRKWARVMQDGLMQLVVLGIIRNVLKSCEHFLCDKFLEESQRNSDEMLLQAKEGEGKKAQRVCAKPGNKTQRTCWVHAVGKAKAHKSLFISVGAVFGGCLFRDPLQALDAVPSRIPEGISPQKCRFSSSQEPYHSHWNGILF